MITAKVKGIYTTTMDNLEEHVPEDSQKFCVFVRVMAGAQESEGAEAFDVKVCSPQWLEQEVAKDGFAFGVQSLFVTEYNPARIKKLLTKFFERHNGSSWQEVAQKLTRIAHWEFEDYPEQGPPHNGKPVF